MRPLPSDILPGGSLPAALLFGILFLTGIAGFWLTDRLPLVDMPQHAGQIAAVRDILLGQFKWSGIVETNWFTPYLVVPLVSAVLAMALPIPVVLSLALSLAYALYVGVALALRRQLNANPQFDFLILIGFFGFSYQWGFFIYLVAVPFGLLFMLMALGYARQPSRKAGLKLLCMGVFLFLLHGLVFLFAGLVGGMLLLRQHCPRSIKEMPSRALLAWPYMVLAVLTVIYGLSLPEQPPKLMPTIWDLGIERFVSLFYGLAQDINPEMHLRNLVVVAGWPAYVRLAAVAILLIAVIGHIRFRKALESENGIFISVFLIVYFAYPSRFTAISFLFERHHIYLLPFLTFLTFIPATSLQHSMQQRGRLTAVLFLSCAAYMGANIVSTLAFRDDDRFFSEATAPLEPGQRMMALIFDNSSYVGGARYVPFQYAVWYQSEKGGWVDFNFASNYQQVVRYPFGVNPTKDFYDGWEPSYFDWKLAEGRNFRYFITRLLPEQKEADITQLLANDECPIKLVSSAGAWRVYEQTNCLP